MFKAFAEISSVHLLCSNLHTRIHDCERKRGLASERQYSFLFSSSERETGCFSHPWGWHWRLSAHGQWSRGPSWSQASMSISKLGWFRQGSPFTGLGLQTGNKNSVGSRFQSQLKLNFKAKHLKFFKACRTIKTQDGFKEMLLLGCKRTQYFCTKLYVAF